MVKINWKLVDASEQIMGRMCSQIAKYILLGEHVVIINAKDCVISGRRNMVLAKYVHLRRNIRNASNPRRGPFHGSRPDTFLRQKIRFMLPKNQRGRDAFHNVHVYIAGIPKAKKNKY
ncbi:MAG: 50S ribosomal protein L13, partial [Promethearchaeota archaeon]